MGATAAAVGIAGATFAVVWLLAVAAIFVKALRPGALLQRGDPHVPFARRLLLALCALPIIALLAVGTLFNTAFFVVALCWHRVRGKALPADPRAR